MRRLIAVSALTAAALFLGTPSFIDGAGANAGEEAAIRQIIAGGSIRETSDAVLWDTAYKRPVIGNERREFCEECPASYPDRVPGSQSEKVKPIKIVVADSRDMAWEYSSAIEEFDLKNGKHIRQNAYLLRVWEKHSGEWRQAAEFIRPHL